MKVSGAKIMHSCFLKDMDVQCGFIFLPFPSAFSSFVLGQSRPTYLFGSMNITLWTIGEFFCFLSKMWNPVEMLS
jgi:hypothetical protein